MILLVAFLRASDELATQLAGFAGLVSAVVAVMTWRREAAASPPHTSPTPDRATLRAEVTPSAETAAAARGEPAPVVELRFLSFETIDIGAIEESFARFGGEWPEVKIVWPLASSEIPDKIRAGLQALDRAGPGERPSDARDWIRNASKALSALTRDTKLVEGGLPAYARRVSQLSSFRTEAIERYLQRAHQKLFSHAAGFVRWPGLRKFGIEAPPEWDSFFARYSNGEEALRHLLDPSQPLRRALVSVIDGQELGDNAVYVEVPASAAMQHPWLGDVARYFAPGLELCFGIHDRLPAVYAPEPVIMIEKVR